MRLLLISNSTMPGEPYLEYPKYEIEKFLGKKPITALFIPYAAVTFSFDQYVERVGERFSEIGHIVVGIHTFRDPVTAVHQAEAIVVGGGNTWQLVRLLNDYHLMAPIRERIFAGIPYIGWSAGANVACPTLRTTNDMPIIDPHGFETINLVPFQINPHYLDTNPDGHAGETREQRILEFIEETREQRILEFIENNPGVAVVGLREGSMLLCQENHLSLLGKRSARIFNKGEIPVELSPLDNFSFLLNRSHHIS
jgi:dipeptidase E